MATIVRFPRTVPSASVMADGDLALTPEGRELRASWRVSALVRAAEVDAAYAEQAEAQRVADERAALVEEFVAARRTGVWMEEMRVLAKARRFDDAHPSRDPLFDELHADQLFGAQYGEAA